MATGQVEAGRVARAPYGCGEDPGASWHVKAPGPGVAAAPRGRSTRRSALPTSLDISDLLQGEFCKDRGAVSSGHQAPEDAEDREGHLLS